MKHDDNTLGIISYFSYILQPIFLQPCWLLSNTGMCCFFPTTCNIYSTTTEEPLQYYYTPPLGVIQYGNQRNQVNPMTTQPLYAKHIHTTCTYVPRTLSRLALLGSRPAYTMMARYSNGRWKPERYLSSLRTNLSLTSSQESCKEIVGGGETVPSARI